MSDSKPDLKFNEKAQKVIKEMTRFDWSVALLTVAIGSFGVAGMIPDYDKIENEVANIESTEVHETHDHSHAEHSWSYEGDTGPEYWGEFSDTCSTGKFQSPINLSATDIGSNDSFDINYSSSPLTIVNNGHTIQVEGFDEGNSLTIDGKDYELLQYHFHTPSEYTVDGERFPMEMHLVHTGEDGNLAVIGVMIREGAENSGIAPIWDVMPEEAGSAESFSDIQVNPADLVPDDSKYYKLSGSLTTPPCTEGVKWVVMEKPIEFSKTQIEKFQKAHPHNSRPLQDTNGRGIEEGSFSKSALNSKSNGFKLS